MNDELTQRYLSEVIGNFTISFGDGLVKVLCEMSVRRTIDLSIPNDVQLLSHLCYEDFNKKGEPCKAGLDWSKATIQAIWQSKADNLFEKVTDSFIEDVSRREAFVSGSSSRKEDLDSRSRWCRL